MKSHGFYDGQRIRWLFIVLILFILKKKTFLPSKKSKRFSLREILKKTAVHGLCNNLIHEVRISDREFYFKFFELHFY